MGDAPILSTNFLWGYTPNQASCCRPGVAKSTWPRTGGRPFPLTRLTTRSLSIALRVSF